MQEQEGEEKGEQEQAEPHHEEQEQEEAQQEQQQQEQEQGQEQGQEDRPRRGKPRKAWAGRLEGGDDAPARPKPACDSCRNDARGGGHGGVAAVQLARHGRQVHRRVLQLRPPRRPPASSTRLVPRFPCTA